MAQDLGTWVGKEVAQDRGLTGQTHIPPGRLLEPSTYTFDYCVAAFLPGPFSGGGLVGYMPSAGPPAPSPLCGAPPPTRLGCLPPALPLAKGALQSPLSHPDLGALAACPTTPLSGLTLTGCDPCTLMPGGPLGPVLASHFGFGDVWSSVGVAGLGPALGVLQQERCAPDPRD